MSNKNYGGIDVAKQNVVIGIFGYPKTKTEANNPNGHTNTVEYLKKHNVNLVVLESTGGLEVPLANALYAAGMRVVIANPQRTHKYAESFSLGKTDHLDAKMLADYAQALDARKMVDDILYVPPSAEIQELEALVKRRSQLVEMRKMEKNRLEQTHASQKASVTALIAHLGELICRAGQRHRQVQQERLRRQRRNSQRDEGSRKHDLRHPTVDDAGAGQGVAQTRGGVGRRCAATAPERRQGEKDRLHRRAQDGAQRAVHGGADGDAL